MDIPKFGAIHPFFGQHHIVKHVFFPAEAHPSISMKTLILKKWNRDCEVIFFIMFQAIEVPNQPAFSIRHLLHVFFI
jgi:hypothetical protein